MTHSTGLPCLLPGFIADPKEVSRPVLLFTGQDSFNLKLNPCGTVYIVVVPSWAK